MSTTDVVVCPDCGKVIAVKGSVDEAVRCKCAEAASKKFSVKDVPLRPSINIKMPLPNDTSPDELPSNDDTDALPAEKPSSASRSKTCYICGADLTGRVRLKDHLGRYWCKACAKKDKKQRREEEKHKCDDCSRPFPPDKLMYFQTARVCMTCFKEREKRLEKKIAKAAAKTIHEKHEIQKIVWMAVVLVVLLGLGLLGHVLKFF